MSDPNKISKGAVSVSFDSIPLRSGSGPAPELFQVRGKDSAGDTYVYDKSTNTRVTHSLTLPRETDANTASIKSFFADETHGSEETFSWWDETAILHTVRLIGAIKYTPVGPDQNRIELVFEENIAWSFPAVANWAAAVAAKNSAPVWILRLTVNGTDYYLSDNTFTLPATSIETTPGWPDGVAVTTKPWVAKWGEVRESVTGDLNEIKIADFSVECLIAPAASPNLEDLATGYELEKNPAELYLWYHGLNAATDPPRLRMRGYIIDNPILDDTTIQLKLEDEASRLYNYIGTRLDIATHPEADPDDVGKMIPIVLGSPPMYPALGVDVGVSTSLVGFLDFDDTSFVVSEIKTLSAGTVIQIDAEKILIGSVSGNTLSGCTRHYGGTSPSSHDGGAMVMEWKSEFFYLAADHPVDTIPAVFAKVGQAVLNITAIVTRYLGTSGNQHASYPGKAVIKVPGFVSITQAVDLGLDNGLELPYSITSVFGALSLNDTLAILQGSHDHPQTSVGNVTLKANGYQAVTGSWQNIGYAVDNNTGTYARQLTVPASVQFTYNGGYSNGYTPLNVWAQVLIAYGGAFPFTVNFQAGAGNSVSFQGALNGGTTVGNATMFNSPALKCTWAQLSTPASTWISIQSVSSNALIILDVQFLVEYGTPGLSASPATGVSRQADTGVALAGLPEISGDTALSGTLALSGNSIANTLVGEQILVQCTHNVTAPGESCAWLLNTRCNISSFSQVGSFPAGYAFDSVINEYKRAIDLLDAMAFQSRAYFRIIHGMPTLIVRPDTLTSSKTIPACCVDGEGNRIYSRRKAPLSKVLNKIEILYNRDWTQAKSDEAYKSTAKGTGTLNFDDPNYIYADSVADYGVREQPELFYFDFVTTSAMVESVREFMLARYHKRPWLHDFPTYLDHSELKFADVVTLGFNGDLVGEIQEAGSSPGDKRTMDTMEFVVEV